MAPDPRPHQRRRPGARRRPLLRATDLAGRWPRLRQPVLYAVVAATPLPVALALGAGHVTGVLLVLGGLIVAAGLVPLAWRRRVVRHAVAEAAASEHAERVLQEVFDDWVRQEAGRGDRELDRWRRTHRL